MSFTNIFGGSPQRPAYAQYEALALAANTALVWPLETAEGTPYVAAQIDVLPSLANLSLAMPPANQGGQGVASIMSNTGGQAFTLTDTSGNQIVIVQPGVSWIITLTDNSTLNGVWRAYQLGATVSNANAGQLADNQTTQAQGSTLRVFFPTNYLIQNTNLIAASRGSVNVWQGTLAQPAGIFALDTAANLGDGWFAFVANENATGNLTIQPTGQTINGLASLVLTPGNTALISCTIKAGVGTFNALGLVPSPLPVAGGGTGAQTANQALINFGASTTGIAIFTAASSAAVLALLGLTTVSFVEATVATNQTLNLSSSQSCFVATAALVLNLPLTTTLTTKYVFCVYAQGGNVTVTPNIADKINNATAGANFTVVAGTSAMFTTDANGNWWPFFTSTGGTVNSVGLSAPAEFTVTGSPVTTTGTLTFSKSNQNANLIYAGPASGGAAPPTFRALTGADGAVPTGTVIMSAALQTPSGFLLCDGTAVSRTTFAALFNAVSIQTTGNITNGSPIIPGMGTTVNMAVGMPISAIGIPAGTTVLSIDGPTQIHISQNATATTAATPIVVAPFGIGDGTTTFNVPDQRGRTMYGADAMQGGASAGRLGPNASAGGFTAAAVMGAVGGAQTHVQTLAEMVAHGHPGSSVGAIPISGGFGQVNGGAAFEFEAGPSPDPVAPQTFTGSISIASAGSSTAANITAPGAAYFSYIKF
jgi:hypothetical protein